MHPKVATLLPVAHLDRLEEDEYLMALSHLVDIPEYEAFFRKQACAGKYVILDTSVVEQGDPEPFEEYMQKAGKIGATEVMLPDHYRDAGATMAASFRALNDLATHGDLQFFRVMAVPHGETVAEWAHCCNHMVWDRRIDSIGVSCRYTEDFGGSRARAVDIAWNYALKYHRYHLRIHLLGAYAGPQELRHILSVYPHLVQGVDSSYPAVFTSHGFVMDPQELSGDRPERDIDFAEDEYSEDLLDVNLSLWWEALCPKAG